MSDLHSSQVSLSSFDDVDFAEDGEQDDDWQDLDDTFTGDYSSDEDSQSVSSSCSIPLACVALYNFEVCSVLLQ